MTVYVLNHMKIHDSFDIVRKTIFTLNDTCHLKNRIQFMFIQNGPTNGMVDRLYSSHTNIRIHTLQASSIFSDGFCVVFAKTCMV